MNHQLRPEILTASGQYFNFDWPQNDTFDIFTIAHALSNICRFTGIEPLSEHIQPLDPFDAMVAFLNRYEAILVQQQAAA